MIYVEMLRIEAYASIHDVKRLKALRDDYAFWEMAAPAIYRNAWKLTKEYCAVKLAERGVN